MNDEIIGNVFIEGTPVPQGSKRGYARNGFVSVVEDNKKTNPWRADIHAGLRDQLDGEIVFPAGPVQLELDFVMPRRKTEPKRQTPPHIRKPDIDKLVRAVLDAVKGLLYSDDSQVVGVRTSKRTAEIGEQPGLHLGWFGDRPAPVEKPVQLARSGTITALADHRPSTALR